MDLITRAELDVKTLTTAEGVTIGVRAPGFHVRWRSVEASPTAMVAFNTAAAGGHPETDWGAAMAEHGLKSFTAVEATPLAFDEVRTLTLSMPESNDVFVEMRAPRPTGQGLLAMVETDGIVQWFLPVNVPRILPEAVPFDGPVAIGEAAPAVALVADVEAAMPDELQFLIPHSVLASGGTEVSAFGLGAAGLGGAIVHFFRFDLVSDLIGAAEAKVIDFIVKHVDTKPEGFRRFDSGFPLMTKAELQAMNGRVLLMTHGVFSSLQGAFRDIADPDGDVLKHLRTIYGQNIIGWDHRTVAKSPLENAAEMLAALPPNMQPPDILCHSRGALVTRAMLEHSTLEVSRKSRFAKVGKAIFIAGATQGSQLASETHLNRLLNIYSAIGSLPILGGAGVVLNVIVGLLKVIAHGATRLPSIQALSSDVAKNKFLQELNEDLMTPIGEIVVAHANYDPSEGPLAKLLDLNVDTIFNTANDLVVPFTTAEVFDKLQKVGTNVRFGSATEKQSKVLHTTFFANDDIQKLLQTELV
ncbi:MAG: hypothetical protein QOE82_1265 [Thermoanaerobaculia bacterium]|jgi:hypothetical protein|nr:hypothetical protein [Thermoanaerobaculia bacterium]